MSRQSRLPLAYAGLALTYLAVAVNLSVTSVALPSIGTDLGASTAQLSWIFNITPLVSAGVMLFAGAWGDRFGRRRLLVIGLGVFGCSAILSALATNVVMLIAFRAFTGIGSALAMPSALALTFDVVPERGRRTAIGILGATQAGGSLIGPVLAGAAMALWAWPAAFLTVVPFIVIALIGTRRLPRGLVGAPEPMDARGATLTSIASLALVTVAVELSARRVTAALIAVAVTVACVIALAAWERRTPHPLFDAHVLRQRGFRIATLVVFGSQLVLGGLLFAMTQYLQLVLGHSPLVAGLMLTPALVGWVLASVTSSRTAALLGVRWAVALGLALSAGGLAVLALVGAQGTAPPPGLLIAGLLLTGLMAVGPALMTHAAVDSYPPAHRTIGAATNGAAARFGFSFGIALLGGLLGARYASEVAPATDGLAADQAAAVEAGLAGAQTVAATVPDGSALIDAARSAFLSGYVATMVLAWVIAAAMALVVALGSQSVEDPRHRGARAGA